MIVPEILGNHASVTAGQRSDPDRLIEGVRGRYQSFTANAIRRQSSKSTTLVRCEEPASRRRQGKTCGLAASELLPEVVGERRNLREINHLHCLDGVVRDRHRQSLRLHGPDDFSNHLERHLELVSRERREEIHSVHGEKVDQETRVRRHELRRDGHHLDPDSA